jgi:hypothetical protein
MGLLVGVAVGVVLGVALLVVVAVWVALGVTVDVGVDVATGADDEPPQPEAIIAATRAPTVICFAARIGNPPRSYRLAARSRIKRRRHCRRGSCSGDL